MQNDTRNTERRPRILRRGRPTTRLSDRLEDDEALVALVPGCVVDVVEDDGTVTRSHVVRRPVGRDVRYDETGGHRDTRHGRSWSPPSRRRRPGTGTYTVAVAPGEAPRTEEDARTNPVAGDVVGYRVDKVYEHPPGHDPPRLRVLWGTSDPSRRSMALDEWRTLVRSYTVRHVEPHPDRRVPLARVYSPGMAPLPDQAPVCEPCLTPSARNFRPPGGCGAPGCPARKVLEAAPPPRSPSPAREVPTRSPSPPPGSRSPPPRSGSVLRGGVKWTRGDRYRDPYGDSDDGD